MSEEQAIEKASSKAQGIIREAEEKATAIKVKAEKSAQDAHKNLVDQEERLDKREKSLLERSKSIDSRYDALEKQEAELESAKLEIKNLKDELETKLEKIANLSREEAKEQLMKEVEETLAEMIAKRIRDSEFKLQSEVEEQSKNLLIDAMQRSATDYVAETTSTTIEIEKDELKGKIIGKDGRNIRAFERMTGVDIIIDEAPNQVTVSSFDPIRREVAAIAISKLLTDGRVHPGTIEETILNIKADVAKEIKKTGEKIAYDTGFNDLPPEIIKLLGRFKYRFSYGQNLVKHSLEMVNIGQQIAQELGADVAFTKKACLLHDIGKVLTHEIEGKPHHHISGDIVRKYLKDEKLANAVESHHGDIEPKSKEALIVQIADSISGARPGARRDNYDDYVKRVKALEDIAKTYKEVKQAFAIHAGREVRVIIDAERADDKQSKILAFKIAKEIEDTQSYPGTVKVNVIREVRFVEEAK
ncbi:ribonuclease Y [Candidatus Dojkabacteria bacterium]|uniref:Ribonuclease Y n=1 Tax=Candidatus Dojkabacteria bacterium TaxID=2099670 RepID=A0A955L872_9BACT|nr:ribonuclease Y [Candidatus Dojkabacteria bacterium]